MATTTRAVLPEGTLVRHLGFPRDHRGVYVAYRCRCRRCRQHTANCDVCLFERYEACPLYQGAFALPYRLVGVGRDSAELDHVGRLALRAITPDDITGADNVDPARIQALHAARHLDAVAYRYRRRRAARAASAAPPVHHVTVVLPRYRFRDAAGGQARAAVHGPRGEHEVIHAEIDPDSNRIVPSWRWRSRKLAHHPPCSSPRGLALLVAELLWGYRRDQVEVSTRDDAPELSRSRRQARRQS